MMILLFAVIICLSLAGCSLQDKIGDYSREQCYLNKENVTQFSYKGNDYTILADTVSNSGLGEWIGYIQQLAAVDESGKILLQENLKTATFQTLADLADLVDKAPNDAYIIPFLNVYAAPNADDYLIVDINGGYHKAVIDENIKGTDTVFDFKDIEQSMSGKFEINPQNATQLLCDGTVYQVTSDTVSNNELGSYIGILAENVIFNAETKIPLSKEELRKIDWYGENAGQHREQWIYKDITSTMWYNGAGGDFLTHLLVVDDEVSILELIKNSLGKDGYLITVCQNADDVDIKKLHFYDLILLDVMMPGTDGFEFCKQIRNMVDCPILFLTAKTLEEDILFGLGIGADDYITKPFRIQELRARVAAHLRREKREHHSTLSFEPDIRFDLSAKVLYVSEQPVPLTKSEYSICEYLAKMVWRDLL